MNSHPKGSKNGDKAAGRIEYRLENERLHLKPEQKKNLKQSKTTILPNISEEPISDTEGFKLIIPTDTNFKLIEGLMTKYIVQRKELIAKGKTFKEIFEAFPQIIAYEGVLVRGTVNVIIVQTGI